MSSQAGRREGVSPQWERGLACFVEEGEARGLVELGEKEIDDGVAAVGLGAFQGDPPAAAALEGEPVGGEPWLEGVEIVAGGGDGDMQLAGEGVELHGLRGGEQGAGQPGLAIGGTDRGEGGGGQVAAEGLAVGGGAAETEAGAGLFLEGEAIGADRKPSMSGRSRRTVRTLVPMIWASSPAVTSSFAARR
jgi:hypothetical protein